MVFMVLHTIGSDHTWTAVNTERCFIHGSLSGDHFLTCGILQGTILGPLLSIININDLPNCLSNPEPRMYADDTHITFASDNIQNINAVLNLRILLELKNG